MELNQSISLAELLESREQRANYQRHLIAKFNSSLVSFMINMPGAVKLNQMTCKLHETGMRLLCGELEISRLQLYHSEVLYLNTGIEGYIATNAEAIALKHLTCKLENTLPYGRLLDFDVFDQNYKQISRIEIGYEQRNCIVCGAAGAGCASRRLHSLDEIILAVNRIGQLVDE